MKLVFEEYPALLQEIPQPPIQLYYEGNIELLQQPGVAVVGSRALTRYGERACALIVRQLVRAGCVIVSGLAIGIDAVAHRAALEAGGQTIAIIGSGLGHTTIFPVTNRPLARRIVQTGGLLLSEYTATTPARAYYFPERNRLIAGCTLGTVVIEAAERSGALLTAKYALDCNREVFAVPGSLFSSRSVGTNRLIQRGAKLVLSGSDILQELGMATADEPYQLSLRYKHGLTPEQRLILTSLETATLSAEQLVQHTGIAALKIMTNLTELAIQGIVRKNREQNYEISHR